MRRWLRWLIVLAVLGGLATAGAVSARSWLQRRLVPKYVTAPVSRGRVETVVNSTGTVKPVLSVSVGAFTSGPIKEVYVDFNSAVKRGDVLALIDTRLAQATYDHDLAALEAQKADLGRVEALVKQAKNNEERARKLVAINKDYLADTDMDTYLYTRLQNEAQYRLGQAAIKQAEATLANSKANLEYTKIVSPVDGIIINREVDPGQTVAASFQTPELFIVAPDMERHMYVYASVDEADIGQVRAAQEREQSASVALDASTWGALASPSGLGPWAAATALAPGGTDRAVKFTVDAYPGELFPGTIHQIRKNSTTTQNVVTYPVVIEAPNPHLKLLPGMTANITFQIESKEDVLRVPAAALRFVPLPAQVRQEDRHHVEAPTTAPTEVGTKKTSAGAKAEQSRKRHQRVVWVKDGDLLRAVPVTLGLIENQFAELLDGELTDGQALVTGTENSMAPR